MILAISSCMKAPVQTQKVSKAKPVTKKVIEHKHTRGISSVNMNLSLEDEIDFQAKQLESSLE